MGVVIGWVAAGGRGGAVLPLVAIYFLLHSGLTIWNDIEDETIDGLSGRQGIATIRRLGLMRELRIITITYVLLAVFLAAYLGPMALAWVALIILCGYVYNTRPLQLSRRPLGSIAILILFYGALPVLLGASYAGLSALSVALAGGYGVLRGSLSVLKDYKDAPSDAKHNKRTFLLVYGARAVEKVSIVAAAIGFILILSAITALVGGWVWMVVATIIAGWLLAKRWQLREAKSYKELNIIFHNCLYYQLIFDGVVLVWLVLQTTS
jgi:4-hydroxybenzoate polyprenyltransferase